MKTRVSVIIPIYNVYEFLEECIDSVLAQTINKMELSDDYQRNLQIILVDDGSTDNSPMIAKKYAENFENVEYVYEENQGLGHARNYGCEFAQGDYIIFLDSDDVVSPNAYEWLYRAAIKNNSDMAIGAVWRFNSEMYTISTIHEKAFNGTKEVTHITESPELFYDTTAWNKLIKRSFWDEHEFKFPEGILYEDIPVTIPMHFLANNVSIIYENCYLWRVREGKSKSITQTTADSKTLNDRLYVMGLVDEFFDENVSDKNLHHVKNQKWLKNDLMIFINKLKSVDKKDADETMHRVREYVQNNIDKEELGYLHEFEKLKYDYLLENNFDKLVDLLNFETDLFKVTKVYKKDSHIMFDANEDLFKTSHFTIDNYIKGCLNAKFIHKVDINDENIVIEGFTVIPGLDIKSFDDRTYSFYLINSNTHKKIPLDYDDIKINNISSNYDIRYGRRFSYQAAGFRLKLSYSQLFDNKNLIGENRILVTFTQQDITYNFFVASDAKDFRLINNKNAKIFNDTYFRIRYTLKNEILIDILPIDHIYNKLSIDKNNLYIHSSQFNGNLFLNYPADSLNKEKNLSFDYDDENKYYKLNLNNISSLKGQIKDENGNLAIFNTKDLKTLHSSNNQYIISPVYDYYMDVFKFKNTTEAFKIDYNNGSFKIYTKLYSRNQIDNLVSARLYYKNKLTFEKYFVSDGKYIKENGEFIFSLDLSKNKVTKNIYQETHELFVEYTFDNNSFSTPIHVLKEFNQNYSRKLHNYRVYQDLDGILKIEVISKWPFYENTPGKRLRHSRLTYKLFNKLPINNKRILFESMWGSKYSCNPQFLYEYIDENYPDYECIWALEDTHFPIKGKGKRVRIDSVKYLYYLATSKFFVNNVNFPDYYVKREGQIEVQTMHGTPLKTLGIDVPGDFPTKKSEKDFIKKCSRWDYLTVQSDFVADIAKRCFVFNKKFLKDGYPRTDILYTKNNQEDIDKLKEKMGIPLDKKVILYAPTWRIRNKFDLMIDLDSFKESLSDDYVLILRLHHFSVNGWIQPPKDEFVYDFSNYGSIEELYLISDVLITDYSSVMFDYAILDRPIILFTYDLEEYKENLRGVYIDIEDNAPGPIVFTSSQVEDAILNLDKTENETKQLRKSFQEKFNQFECRDSSRKVFDKVMKNHDNESIISKIFRKILP